MMNSHGHLIYDFSFSASTNFNSESVAELFEQNGHIYSVFSYNNKFHIYKNHENIGSHEYETQDTVVPLSFFYDSQN